VVSAGDYAKAKPAKDIKSMSGTAADLIPIMQKGRRLGFRFKRTPIYLSARPPIDFSDDKR
jgi:hypothetical protein